MKGSKQKMKTYEATITISVIIDANNEDEAYEMAENWYKEETHPSYDIEINEISFLDFDNIIASNERK